MDAARLRNVPLFEDLSPADRERIARWADEVELPRGAHLLDEGRFPHEFFVVLEGTVDVLHDGDRIAALGPGDILGEIAILEGLRRTATVVAATEVRAAVMHQRDFREMCEEFPVVEERVRGKVRERLGR
jgi:CRP-like cAMP-binding protein